MTCRRLLNVAYFMLVEANGQEEVDEAFTPAVAGRVDRRAQLHDLGVEVTS